MRATAAVAMLVLGGVVLGCTPAPTGGGGGANLVGSCRSEPNWAYGDSITSGYGVPGWPDQDPPIPTGTFANRAIGGAAIGFLADKLALDLATCGPGELPDRVVFFAGANDLGTFTLPLSTMEAGLDRAVAAADSYGVPITLAPITPMPSWADWAYLNGSRIAYNDWMATTYPQDFVDCATPLLDGTGLWLNTAYAWGDRSHLNDAGAEVLAGCIYNAI